MPKPRNHKLNLLETPKHPLYKKIHTNFRVKEVAKYGDTGRYRVEWSANFGGVVYHDYLMLYAEDELDAFKLAIASYGGDDERSES